MSQGHLYIAQSSSYPDMVKIGLTTKTPASRVKNLSGAGSLAEWTPVAVRAVGDVRAAERLVHARLDQLDARVKVRRELFTVAPEVALSLVEDAARMFPPVETTLAAASAASPFTIADKWNALLALRVRAQDAFVPLRDLVCRHANTFDVSVERCLARFGIRCVNPKPGRVVYQIDVERARSLENQLFLEGETVSLHALRKGDLLVVTACVN
jgi:hypothetical protein